MPSDFPEKKKKKKYSYFVLKRPFPSHFPIAKKRRQRQKNLFPQQHCPLFHTPALAGINVFGGLLVRLSLSSISIGTDAPKFNLTHSLARKWHFIGSYFMGPPPAPPPPSQPRMLRLVH
uniref:(northern house mosquito) hypothetical protein n=1 Tax=Culex pipiens TaxID=7175 RepID=A0A8D8IT82_CULPI